jgi:hypothetical protein
VSQRNPRFPKGSHLADVVADLLAIEDKPERTAARSAIKENALLFRRRGRRYLTGAKLADAAAKFGGGSLLTATLLLIVGGQTGGALLVTSAFTLFLFVAGTIIWAYCDMQAAQWEYQAEWLEALLKESED